MKVFNERILSLHRLLQEWKILIVRFIFAILKFVNFSLKNEEALKDEISLVDKGKIHFLEFLYALIFWRREVGQGGCIW